MAGDPAPSDSAASSGGPSRPSSSPLTAAIGRLRREPSLFVPYLAVGLLFAALDWVRRRDPLPTVEYERLGSNGLSITVEFLGYPSGIARTSLPLEALVGLRVGYLCWGLVAYVLPLLAVATAGAYVIGRALDLETEGDIGTATHWVGSIRPLFGFVLAMDLFQRLLGSIELLQSMGLFGLVPLALYFLFLVWLFAVPGLLVAGYGPLAAVRLSDRLTQGYRWTIFGIILVLGLGAWLLASLPVPFAGPVLSTVLVAPVHAVVLAVVLRPLERY